MYCILYTLVDLYVLYTVQFALVGTALQDRRNFIMTLKIGYTMLFVYTILEVLPQYHAYWNTGPVYTLSISTCIVCCMVYTYCI